MSKIIDISHHQGVINWDELAKDVALVIIRVQDGSSHIDRHYKTYVAEAKKRGIPFGHYAFTRFTSVADARKEAQDFYSRGDKDALFWVADVEVKTASNMVECTQAYIDELRKLGAKKVGAYYAHHLYLPLGLAKVTGADFKWFPRYGANDGKQNVKPAHPCEMWQYTSAGKVAGIKGDVDVNVLIGDKTIEWFTEIPTIKVPAKPKPAPKTPLPTGVYKRGDKGNDVKLIQAALNRLHFKVGKVDGIYGAKTADAIRRFQSVYDADHVDSIYGKRTKALMEKLLK